MHSPVTTSAAVPPLARVGGKRKPKTSFLRMLGIVLGWVLLLLLLLYCEAAIVVAYRTAAKGIRGTVWKWDGRVTTWMVIPVTPMVIPRWAGIAMESRRQQEHVRDIGVAKITADVTVRSASGGNCLINHSSLERRSALEEHSLTAARAVRLTIYRRM